ncbi:PPE family protein [Mycobacterium tuberculosis SUMu002]|nr:PPE family protein [Mycobacterium tuberculosis SUMu002]
MAASDGAPATTALDQKRNASVDFGALPPEVNSARMYGGAGAADLLAAAAAWNGIAVEVSTAASSVGSVITRLSTEHWMGPASLSMAAAVQPYLVWLTCTAESSALAAAQAMASAAAFETAFALTVPPAEVVANRALLAELTATNILGQKRVGHRGYRGTLWRNVGPRRFGHVRLCGRIRGRRKTEPADQAVAHHQSGRARTPSRRCWPSRRIRFRAPGGSEPPDQRRRRRCPELRLPGDVRGRYRVGGGQAVPQSRCSAVRRIRVSRPGWRGRLCHGRHWQYDASCRCYGNRWRSRSRWRRGSRGGTRGCPSGRRRNSADRRFGQCVRGWSPVGAGKLVYCSAGDGSRRGLGWHRLGSSRGGRPDRSDAACPWNGRSRQQCWCRLRTTVRSQADCYAQARPLLIWRHRDKRTRPTSAPPRPHCANPPAARVSFRCCGERSGATLKRIVLRLPVPA